MRRLLFVAGALFLCANAYCLTLGTARTEVRRLVRDSPASGLYRYSDTILNTFLNESERQVINQTWCLEESAGYTLAIGTTYYSLPVTSIKVKGVKFRDSSDHTRELSETSYRALRQNNPDYERLTGPPMQYAVRQATQSSTQNDIMFLPIPASSSQGGRITVDYYKQGDALVSDSDVLLNGQTDLIPYHEAIVYETVAKIKLIENDPAASTYIQLYQTQIQAMNSRLGEKPNLSPGFSAGNSNVGSPVLR